MSHVFGPLDLCYDELGFSKIDEEEKPPNKDERSKEEDSVQDSAAEPKLSPREVVERASETNAIAGNENLGSLSFSHGFAPRLTSLSRFPPAFDAWNELREKLPWLLSSGKLRDFCDSLPVLDAEKLPPAFALFASSVLGYTSHAYWHIGGAGAEDAPKALPSGLEKPWRQVNALYLQRGDVTSLGLYELCIANFRFAEGSAPSPQDATQSCPWATDELSAYGAVDYDPSKATVESFHPANWFTCLREERYFYGLLAELHTKGAPIVKLAVELQEAVGSGDTLTVKKLVEELLSLLLSLTSEIFKKIQQQRKSPYYVDACIWAKVIAPLAVPLSGTSFGPSGTAAPIVHLLDALFGRIKYEHYIGKEITILFDTHPPHWKQFLNAFRKGPSIQEFVASTDDTELQGLFAASLRAYADETGFLGRHKLKMVGYLELAIKLGRPKTSGGFSLLLKDRTWDRVADELEIGQEERFAIPLAATATHLSMGRVLQVKKEHAKKLLSAWPSVHVRVNIEDAGIRYKPGSHVGVLYESSEAEVQAVLLAFADGDIEKAKRLGKEFMVPLTNTWIVALRSRPEYHATTSFEDPALPNKLGLYKFLKWGMLRPASRQMLQLAYRLSHSREIQTILAAGREKMLNFSDVVTILRRNGIDLLKDGSPKSRLASVVRRGVKLTKLYNELSEGSGGLQQSQVDEHLETAGYGDKKRFQVRSGSINEFMIQYSTIHETPMLSELVEPAGYRVYSVASSPTVHPNEIHLLISRVDYEQKSPVALTSPLAADLEPPVRRQGAASDYILSHTIPREVLAVDALVGMAGIKRTTDPFAAIERFFLNEERREYLKSRASLLDEELNEIIAVSKSFDGGEVVLGNLCKAIDNVLSDKTDPREPLSVVLRHYASPRFQLPPADDATPCIMIAGGTGLAPFRSFWQELALRGCLDSGVRHLLLIQLRDRNTMAFERELHALVKARILDVEIIFSREETRPDFSGSELLWRDSPGRKGYLDTVIEGPLRDRMAYLIRQERASIFVCGRGGMAKTVVNALDSCLVGMFGDERGKEEMERLVAENRLVLDIFTTLEPSRASTKQIGLSELCMCNDFVGNRSTYLFHAEDGDRSDSKKVYPLRLVIGAFVYEVKDLVRLHPGGDALIKLYCGMDATKAWKAVGHDKAPEVAAMLEMYDAQISFQKTEMQLSGEEVHWYTEGWEEMTQDLVEIQNAIALAFQTNWDSGNFTSAEENLGGGFTVWEGAATWRPKRSVLKGVLFAEIHQRLWTQFFPLLFGKAFELIVSHVGLTAHAEKRMTAMEESKEHFVCDALHQLICAEVKKVSSSPETLVLPADLQGFLEEIRIADELVLENIKKSIVRGLKVFETNKSPLLPGFQAEFECSVLGILDAVELMMKKLCSLSVTVFGLDKVHAAVKDPLLKRGGLTAATADEQKSRATCPV